MMAQHPEKDLHLAAIKLTQFKNHEATRLQLSPRLNCITGLNGVGKTNILDAIHYLCLTKSHRGLPDKLLMRHGSEFFRLEGWFESEGESPRHIVVKMPSGRPREWEQNGVAIQRISEYIGQFPAVMIAPDDVSLIHEGSEERRRLIDSTISQVSPAYLQSLIAYNALLKRRNALLKTFAEEKRYDALLLEAIDTQMYAPAAFIFDARKQWVEAVKPALKDYYKAISGNLEDADLLFESDLFESDLPRLFSLNTERDRVLARTGAGPHRDDLSFLLDEKPVKKFASQGQIKSYLLAIRLAQYDYIRQHGRLTPLLLLDDIFDKLDHLRVRQLIALLMERQFGQIFITDTHRERLSSVVGAFEGDCVFFEL